MKIIKSILLIVAVIVVVALIAALFVKKEYALERSIVVNKPNSTVFEYVKLIKNQNYYSVWNMKDPSAKKEYKGTDGTVGFVASWESNNKEIGKGEQEIIKIVEGERIDLELRFKEPFEATDYAYMSTETVADNQTRVRWGFNGKMPYPMNLMLVFMNMDEMLGKDLAKGLDNLKTNIEK